MLSRFLAGRVEEAFGHKAGVSIEDRPFLESFADSDPEDFVR
jgi:hypothetical protein